MQAYLHSISPKIMNMRPLGLTADVHVFFILRKTDSAKQITAVNVSEIFCEPEGIGKNLCV